MTTVKLHLGEYTQDLESVVQDKDNEIAVETCPPPPPSHQPFQVYLVNFQ